MTEKELNRFFVAISPTEEQKEKVLAELMKGERKMKKIRKKVPLALAAVLILSLAGITAMAAAFGWHERLMEYFSPTDRQMAQMEGSVDRPEISAEDNGFTVKVLQTITDNHGIYVLYELTTPPEILLNEDIRWHMEGLSVQSEPGDGSYTTMGTGGSKVLEISDNRMTVLLRQDSNRKLISGQEISLHLNNLVSYTVTEDDIVENVIGRCKFSLSWQLSYQDETKVFDLNREVHIAEGAHNVLEKVEISPMSAWFFIAGDDVTGAAKPVIKMKDGSEIRLEVKNDFNTTYTFANYQDEDGGMITIGYCFDRVVDISDIESVSVGDVTVSVGESAPHS